MTRRYIICSCDTVYERTTEILPRMSTGSFRCACGETIGAWNGRIALRYMAVSEPEARAIAEPRNPQPTRFARSC